jgi:hypothetical protein
LNDPDPLRIFDREEKREEEGPFHDMDFHDAASDLP